MLLRVKTEMKKLTGTMLHHHHHSHSLEWWFAIGTG
jgi:hypothetical protein